jgi:tetratricopeptide (TPR) repeat protein
VVANTEYDAYRAAVDAERPEVSIRLIEGFLKTYPNSRYAGPALLPLMNAYRVTGANQKALDTAEKVLASDPDQEQALIIVAQVLLDRRANYPRIVAICNKLLAAYQNAAPGSADVEKRKALVTGLAYQILGYAHVFENKFEEAERYLRLGLPYAKGNPQTEAGLLFYIGYANYYLEKYAAAAEYFRRCLDIPSAFQEQAKRQIFRMRQERRIQENE